jgi:hypothetical protein
MKLLLRLTVLIAFLSFSVSSNAQSFGIKGGFNMSNVAISEDGEDAEEDFKYTPGFHFGPVVDIPLSDNFSIEAGLLATSKGAQMKEEEMGFEYSMKLFLLYVDVPVLAKVSFDAGGAKIYAAVGPYVGGGIMGKSKYEASYGGETESETEDIEWGSGEDADLKRLDYGVSAGAGVQFGSLQLGVSYGYGLANLDPTSDSDFKINNRVLGVSLGYWFGGK